MISASWSHKPISAVGFFNENLVLCCSGCTISLYNCESKQRISERIINKNETIHGFELLKTTNSCLCVQTDTNFVCEKLTDGYFVVYGNKTCYILRYNAIISNEIDIVNIIKCSFFIYGCMLTKRNNSLYIIFSSTCNALEIYEVTGENYSLLALISKKMFTDASLQYCANFQFFGCRGKYVAFYCCGTSNGVLISKFPLISSKKGLCEDKFLQCVSRLNCQKGVIFSLDTSWNPCFAPESCILATAAEDRSVAIWISHAQGRCVTAENAFADWKLIHHLQATIKQGILFEARIWSVRIFNRGFVTAGEDCNLLYCEWPKSDLEMFPEPVILKKIHRGRSIWSIDARFIENKSQFQLISGGNDGAIALTSVNLNSTHQPSIQSTHTIPADIVENIPTIRIPAYISQQFLSSQVNSKWPQINHEMEMKLLPLTNDLIYPSESIMSSAKPRCVFIGPCGRVYTILESGELALAGDSHIAVTGTASGSEDYSGYSILHPEIDSSFKDHFDSPLHSCRYPDGNCLHQELLFPGYCVVGVNATRTMVALGGRWGRLAIYKFSKNRNLTCLDIGNAPFPNKIMSISWINSHEFVVGIFPEFTFLVKLKDEKQFDVAISSKINCSIYDWITSFEKLNYVQSEEKKRTLNDMSWTTCAAKVITDAGTELVLIGTRSSGLYLYQLLDKAHSCAKLSPVWSLSRCHGKGGVTAIGVVPTSHRRSSSILLTAGRLHGSVRRWHIVNDNRDGTSCTLEPLDQILKPCGLTWVANFATSNEGELLALGFSSVNFCAAEIVSSGMDTINSNGKLHFKVESAGGNRVWDFACLTPSSSSTATNLFVFTAIQRDRVVISVGYVRGLTNKNDSSNTIFIVPQLHGQDINACLLIPSSPANNLENLTVGQQQTPFCTCLTASDNIQMGSFSLIVEKKNLLDGDLARKTLADHYCVTESPPHFYSGHISNIRCLARVEPSSSFVLSGGGRGMLALWRLDDKGMPGLMGWVRLDTSVDENSHLVHYSAKGSRQRSKSAVDLRIMALLGYEWRSGKELLIVVGCSDGSLRLLQAILPCETTNWLVKFHQICNITKDIQATSNSHKVSCILSLLTLSFASNINLRFVYSNTAGLIQGFRVDLETLVVNEEFSGRIEVQNIVTGALGSCAANSVAVDGECIIVGGDDSSLRLAKISTNKILWIYEQKRHYAAVVRVAILPLCHRILSLGSDQRLLLWSSDASVSRLELLSEITLPGLGDPHDFQVLPASDVSHTKFFVMVTGSGLQLCLVRV